MAAVIDTAVDAAALALNERRNELQPDSSGHGAGDDRYSIHTSASAAFGPSISSIRRTAARATSGLGSSSDSISAREEREACTARSRWVASE